MQARRRSRERRLLRLLSRRGDCSIFPGDSPEEGDDDDCSTGGNKNCVDESSGAGKAEMARNEASDDGADNAEAGVCKKAETAALHDFASEPTCNQANYDPPDELHTRLFRRIVSRAFAEYCILRVLQASRILEWLGRRLRVAIRTVAAAGVAAVTAFEVPGRRENHQTVLHVVVL